jgi:hypothetical protein
MKGGSQEQGVFARERKLLHFGRWRRRGMGCQLRRRSATPVAANPSRSPVAWIGVGSLTKPTRGRIVLWLFLALLWFLFLPQQLAMDPAIKHV